MSPESREPTADSPTPGGVPPVGGGPPPRRLSWLHVLGRIVGVLVLAVVVLVVAAVVALQFPAVSRRAALYALGRMYPAPRNRVALGAAGGDWIGGVRLRGVRITREDTLVARADTVTLRWALASLLARHVHLREISVSGATWVVQPPDTTAPKGPSLLDWIDGRAWTTLPVGIDRLALDRVRVLSVPRRGAGALELEDLVLHAHAIAISRAGLAFDLDTLGTRFPTPRRPGRWARLGAAGALAKGRLDHVRLVLASDSSRVDARGGVLFGREGRRGAPPLSDAEFHLVARPLALSDLAGFAPAFGAGGHLTAEVAMRGARADRWTGTARMALDRMRAGQIEVGPVAMSAALGAGYASWTASGVVADAPFALRGNGRPFDARPTYDVSGTLERLPRLAAPGWRRLLPRVDSSIRLGLRGAGYGRRDADLVADASFAPAGPVRGRSRVLGPGDLHARLADARLALDARAGLLGGRAALDATLGLADSVLRYDVRRLALRGVDVARWSSDTLDSDVNATLALRGTGTDPRRMDLVADLAAGPSRYGRYRLDSAGAHATVRRGRLALSGRALTPGGAFAVEALDAQLVGAHEFRVRNLAARRVDLARWSPKGGAVTDLNATLDLAGRRWDALQAKGGIAAGLGPRGPFTARGTLWLQPSTFRRRRIERGSFALGWSAGTATLRGSATAAPGRVDLDASVQPFADAPEVRGLARFHDLDLGALSDSSKVTTALNGTAHFTGRFPGRGPAIHAGANARPAADPPPSWEFSLDLDRSRLSRLTLTGGKAGGRLENGRLDADARLDSPGGATTLDAHGVLGGERTDLSARGSLPLAVLLALTGRDSLPASGAADFTAHVRGADPRTMRAEATLDGRGRIAEARLDTLRGAAHLAAGIVDVDSVKLSSNALRLVGAGRIALFDPADTARSTFQADGRLRDLSVLAPLVGVDTLLATRGRLGLHVSGPRDSITLAASARTPYLRYGTVEVWSLEVGARAALDSARKVRASAAVVRTTGLRASNVHVGDVVASYEDTLGSGSFALQVEANPRTLWRLRAHTVPADEPHRSDLEIDTLNVTGDPGTWHLAQPSRIDLEPGRAIVRGFALVSGPDSIRADGVLASRGGESLAIELHGARLSLFTAWIGRDDVDGTVDGKLALAGTAAAPTARGDLDVHLRPRRQPGSEVRTRLAWSGGRLDLDASFAPSSGAPLTLTGSLPLALSLEPRPRTAPAAHPAHAGGAQAAPASVGVFEGPVDLRLKAAGFSIAAFQPFFDREFVRSLHGRFDVDLRLTGRTHALSGTGTFALTGAGVDLPGLGVRWSRMELAGDLLRDRLRITRATVRSGSGTLNAQGEAQLASLTETRFAVKVHADRFRAVQTGQMRADVSGDVTIGGSNAVPTVDGSVDLRRASYTVETRTAADTVSLSRDDLMMLEETFGIRARAGGETIGQLVYDATRIGLDVKIERGSWLRQPTNPTLALEIAGQVRVTKEPNALPQVTGRLQPVPGHGFVQELGRQFNFTGGEIRFEGDPLRPYLDIQTEYGANSDPVVPSQVTVSLSITGYPDDLQLTLDSDPSMTNSEIVSYLATGQISGLPQQTQNPGGGTQSVAAQAGVSVLTSRLQNLAGQKLGLDVVQIRQDGLRGATVVAGRYINPHLYVGFRQPVSYQDPNAAVTMNTRNTVFELEYVLYKWLVFNLQGEASRVNSFFRSSYAY